MTYEETLAGMIDSKIDFVHVEWARIALRNVGLTEQQIEFFFYCYTPQNDLASMKDARAYFKDIRDGVEFKYFPTFCASMDEHMGAVFG